MRNWRTQDKSGSYRIRYLTFSGFTLIEVIVVLAIISALVAILMPVLGRARCVAYQVLCQSRLRQIAIAWEQYHHDSNGRFYQGVNHNSDFGGWRGQTAVVNRPLNPYLDLPRDMQTEKGAEVFHCPADSGSELYPYPFFESLGNSFQANLLLVGPDQLPTHYGPDWMRTINASINEYLPQLTVQRISEPARLLFVGDWPWLSQWDPLWTYSCGRSWHGRLHHYNFVFLDGHTDYIAIQKGYYLGSDYRIQPFQPLDGLVREQQQAVRCVCEE